MVRANSKQKQQSEPKAKAHRRLVLLIGVLVAIGATYAGTRSWRERLLAESAKSRAVIAAVERATQAHVAREGREEMLASRLRDVPGDLDARLELVRIRWQSRGPAAAAELLAAAPDAIANPRIARMLAAAQRLMGREDQSLATLDRAIDARPTEGDLRTERALLFNLLGFFSEAEADLQSAARHGAEPVPLALARATLARQQNDRRGARRELEAARRLAPDDTEVAKQLAAVLESEDQFDEAAAVLESVATAENEPEIWTALGRVLLRSRAADATQRARTAAERALLLRAEMPAARLVVARCRHREGDLDGARELLETLRREHPRLPGVAQELAQLYRALGRGNEAAGLLADHETWLRQRSEMRRAAMVLMARPGDADALREMGRRCLERGLIGRAIVYLERAERRSPGRPEVTALLQHAREARPQLGASDE